ncbi:MAG: DUF1565 domain-containing protein [candidate division Zixibacteria bacterium]|nr:DUF1565 domain-containing protein [candidate division Zixibacteria bacterium]
MPYKTGLNAESHIIIPLFILILFLLLNCSEDNSPTNIIPDPVQPIDYFVDAVTGSNSNDGSEQAPFRTISHALSVAVASDSIKVQPGIYNVALGEVFPLRIPDSVTLIGDEDNRGTGSDSTVIVGIGAVSSPYFATVVGGDGAALSGFLILTQSVDPFRYSLYCKDVDFTIFKNKISSLWGGIYMEGNVSCQIKDNYLTVTNYGVWCNSSDGTIIRDNQFKSGALLYCYHGDVSVINNSFSGGAARAILVQYDSPLIDSNIFTGMFSTAAVSVLSSSTPKLRRNTFNLAANPCLIIKDAAAPDIGTSVDAGLNVFAGTSGLAIRHQSSATVYAIGNTWYTNPPVCEADIVVTGDGSVVWGMNPGDNCAAPETGEFEADANTVALWHFNEGSGTITADSSDNGYDATLGQGGANEPSWDPIGRFAYGLAFDAAGDEFVLAGSGIGDFSSNQLTIEMWIKTSSAPEYVHLFRSDDICALEMNFQTINFSVGDGSGTNWQSLSALIIPNLNDGNWHYIACTFNGTTLNIFVDGTNRNVDLNAAITMAAPGNYYIGGYPGENYFTGIIDEVRLSKIARSSTEISDYYNLAQGQR